MGRIVLWLGVLLVLTVLLVPAAFYHLALDQRPMALPSPSLAADDMMRLQRLLSRQRAEDDPSGKTTVSLTQADIDTAVTYALLQSAIPNELQGLIISLQQDHATLAGSVELPVAAARRFLNVRVQLRPRQRTLGIQNLQLGYVSLPQWLVARLESAALEQLFNNQQIPGLQAVLSAVEHIEVSGSELHVTYNSSGGAPAANPAGPPAPAPDGLDPDLVSDYLAELSAIAARHEGKRYPMLGLLAPAFDLAKQRSQADPSVAAKTENTAAIVAIALYGADRQLLELAGLSSRFKLPAHQLTLTVHGRDDLAVHFISSALISLFAGNQVAELIGMQKELDDSHTGSGFSREDLMADKAGIRFAELATASTDSALALQADVANLLYDDDLMPSPRKLPPINVDSQLGRLTQSEADNYLNAIDREVNQLLKPIPLYRLAE